MPLLLFQLNVVLLSDANIFSADVAAFLIILEEGPFMDGLNSVGDLARCSKILGKDGLAVCVLQSSSLLLVLEACGWVNSVSNRLC